VTRQRVVDAGVLSVQPHQPPRDEGVHGDRSDEDEVGVGHDDHTFRYQLGDRKLDQLLNDPTSKGRHGPAQVHPQLAEG
jgi:hypothetical protein